MRQATNRKPAPPPPAPVPRTQAGAPMSAEERQKAAIATLKRWTGAKQQMLKTLCGSEAAAQRFAQVLLLAVTRNPYLLTCDLKSLFNSALYCAQRGLEPGVQDGCALVPYKGKVTPIPQYRGLVKQAVETGSVKRVTAHIIYAHDHYEWELGENPKFVHIPTDLTQERGEPIGAYTVITLPDGHKEVNVMPLKDILKRREASAAWRDADNPEKTPWGQWEAEMIKKTVVKDGLRLIPVAPKLRDLLDSDSRLEGGADLTEVLDADVLEVSNVGPEPEKPQSKTAAMAEQLKQRQASQASEGAEGTAEPASDAGPEAELAPSPSEFQKQVKAKVSELADRAIAIGVETLVFQDCPVKSWEELEASPQHLKPVEAFIVGQEKAKKKA